MRMIVGAAAATAIGAEAHRSSAQEETPQIPRTPVVAEDPGYTSEENTGIRIAQALQGAEPTPAPTLVARLTNEVEAHFQQVEIPQEWRTLPVSLQSENGSIQPTGMTLEYLVNQGGLDWTRVQNTLNSFRAVNLPDQVLQPELLELVVSNQNSESVTVEDDQALILRLTEQVVIPVFENGQQINREYGPNDYLIQKTFEVTDENGQEQQYPAILYLPYRQLIGEVNQRLSELEGVDLGSGLWVDDANNAVRVVSPDNQPIAAVNLFAFWRDGGQYQNDNIVVFPENVEVQSIQWNSEGEPVAVSTPESQAPLPVSVDETTDLRVVEVASASIPGSGIEAIRSLAPDQQVTAEGYLAGNEAGFWYNRRLFEISETQRLNFDSPDPGGEFRRILDGVTINGAHIQTEIVQGYVVAMTTDLFRYMGRDGREYSAEAIKVALPVLDGNHQLLGYRTEWVVFDFINTGLLLRDGQGFAIFSDESGNRDYVSRIDNDALQRGEVSTTINGEQVTVDIGEAVAVAVLLAPYPDVPVVEDAFNTMRQLSNGATPQEIVSNPAIQDAAVWGQYLVIKAS